MRFSVALATAFLMIGGGSSRGAPKRRPADERTVRIEGPTIVAFLPKDLAAASDDVEGASEAKWHFETALAEAKACLGRSDVPVRVEIVIGSRVTIDQDGRVTKVRFPKGWPHSIGAYLFDLHRTPCLVNSGAGPSALIPLLPGAAAEFFGVASCVDEEFKVSGVCKGAG